MGYDVGDLVRFTATCVASGGNPADPSQMFFLLKNASGVATHLYGAAPSQIFRTGVGAFFIDVTINQPRGWAVRWVATGGFQSAQEYTFDVNPTFTL